MIILLGLLLVDFAPQVNVSSCAHLFGSWLDISDLQLRRSYVPEQVGSHYIVFFLLIVVVL